MIRTNLPKSAKIVGVYRGFIALSCIHAGLLGWAAYVHSPTQDEIAHVPAGLSIWRFHDTSVYRVNPPLVRMVATAPLLMVSHQEEWKHYNPRSSHRQEWVLGRDFISANGERSFLLFTLARWACIPFSLIGMWVCFCWSREAIDLEAGYVAATLWCFSPNVIGYGSLMTPDIAAASMGLLAAWRLAKWLQTYRWWNAFLAGLTLGLAMLTKSHWVLLLVFWPIIWLIHLLFLKPSTHKLHQISQMCGIMLFGIHILNSGYGYQGTWKQLEGYDFYSTTLSGELRIPGKQLPGNRFEGSFLGGLPVPFPQDFVTGIDLQKVDFEVGRWSYLCGEAKDPGGWWYYYLFGLLFKVPAPTFVLVVMGLSRFIHPASRVLLLKFLPLLLPAISLLLIASLEQKMNRHVRYVFPVLPVLYFCSSLAIQKWRRFAGIMVVLSTLSSLAAYPHSLSFFSRVFGGPDEGHRYLIHSNLDWGQDMGAIRDWIARHRPTERIYIAWDGDISPRSFGIDADVASTRNLRPGLYFISRSEQYHPSGRFAVFRELEPIDTIAFTFDVYKVNEPIQIRVSKSLTK